MKGKQNWCGTDLLACCCHSSANAIAMYYQKKNKKKKSFHCSQGSVSVLLEEYNNLKEWTLKIKLFVLQDTWPLKNANSDSIGEFSDYLVAFMTSILLVLFLINSPC